MLIRRRDNLKRPLWFLLFLLVSIGTLLTTAYGRAHTGATFTVNSTADVNDAHPGNGICETAPGNGVCTLRAAIREANALVGADTINLPAGIFFLTIAGAGEDAAISGDLDISDNVTIQGISEWQTIIGGNDLDRIFHILGNNPEVTLSEMALDNGNVSAGPGGGALYNTSGIVTLDDVYVNASQAHGTGGAILNQGQMRIINTFVVNSIVINGSGGALHNEGTLETYSADFLQNTAQGGNGGGISNSGVVTMTASSVSNNDLTAGLYHGGGIFNTGEMALFYGSVNSNTTSNGGTAGAIMNIGTMQLHGAQVAQNTAGEGGGIVNQGVLTFRESFLRDNDAIAANSRGGAIWNQGELTVQDTSIRLNTAGEHGGGIYNDTGAWAALSNIAVHNNSSGDALGGGLHNEATMLLTNVTVSSNSGGIFSTGAILSVTNTTIANNTGVGVFVMGSQAHFKNSILAGNSGGNCAVPVISDGHNLDSGNSCGFTAAGDLINTDPLLGPLASNGGNSNTHALLAGSPAIDAADNPTCPPTDQRRAIRPVDGNNDGSAICDMGAYEYLSETPTPTLTPTFGPTPTRTPSSTPSPPPSPSPTASFTPLPTPLPTWTRTATPLPTSTPSPSPLPTHTATPSPAGPTPSLTPQPTPTATAVGSSWVLYLPILLSGEP
jgi:CSLREA domain-containing protein